MFWTRSTCNLCLAVNAFSVSLGRGVMSCLWRTCPFLQVDVSPLGSRAKPSHRKIDARLCSRVYARAAHYSWGRKGASPGPAAPPLVFATCPFGDEEPERGRHGCQNGDTPKLAESASSSAWRHEASQRQGPPACTHLCTRLHTLSSFAFCPPTKFTKSSPSWVLPGGKGRIQRSLFIWEMGRSLPVPPSSQNFFWRSRWQWGW